MHAYGTYMVVYEKNGEGRVEISSTSEAGRSSKRREYSSNQIISTVYNTSPKQSTTEILDTGLSHHALSFTIIFL